MPSGILYIPEARPSVKGECDEGVPEVVRMEGARLLGHGIARQSA